MDIDQSARRQARDEFQVIDPDYYDMEGKEEDVVSERGPSIEWAQSEPFASTKTLPNLYSPIAHVFFDDAFYHDENQQRTLNMFVKDFFEAINKAAG